jgi:arylsulfatase A-like enzyme
VLGVESLAADGVLRRAGVDSWSPGAERPGGPASSETTIAELLEPRGYATAAIGKWHVGGAAEFLSLRYGFDEYFGLPYSNDMWPVDFDGNPTVTGTKGRYPPLPLIDGDKSSILSASRIS